MFTRKGQDFHSSQAALLMAVLSQSGFFFANLFLAFARNCKRSFIIVPPWYLLLLSVGS